MTPHPPEPPPLPAEIVKSIVDWLDQCAEWLQKHHGVASAHGQEISLDALANLRLFEDAALLFRESYGLTIDDPG